MSIRPAGGDVKSLDVAAIISDTIKYAMAAMPVPGIDADNPIEPFQSKSTDQTLKHLNVDFDMMLKDVEGQAINTKVKIEKLTDFEDEQLIKQVELLKELQQDIDFLNAFQKELKDVNNTIMKAELEELITANDGTNLHRFMTLLGNWIYDLEQEESQFLKFIGI